MNLFNSKKLMLRLLDLASFLQAFPVLELAAGTASPAYTSPMRPSRLPAP